ncbi:hypothetical protein MDA_GLEAN10000713 [Myotis davidii]|uniref:Uncharacterized protein n=1 Tax=Myotis davidii TaxID=225400 RepID=L5LR80_MYODS|nr:hypothetical protein MDA_GLEAN10000713 [Myotis davidii]
MAGGPAPGDLSSSPSKILMELGKVDKQQLQELQQQELQPGYHHPRPRPASATWMAPGTGTHSATAREGAGGFWRECKSQIFPVALTKQFSPRQITWQLTAKIFMLVLVERNGVPVIYYSTQIYRIANI